MLFIEMQGSKEGKITFIFNLLVLHISYTLYCVTNISIFTSVHSDRYLLALLALNQSSRK